MLRQPQHERKIFNDIKIRPFVLSTVEGLRQSFSTACLQRTIKEAQRAAPQPKSKETLHHEGREGHEGKN
jgi:hypothetical protein